jgi:hypothetical protein
MNHEVRELEDLEGIERRAKGERLEGECADISAHVVPGHPVGLGRHRCVLRASEKPTSGDEGDDQADKPVA